MLPNSFIEEHKTFMIGTPTKWQGRRHSQKSGAERLALGGAITQGAASLKGAAW